MTDPEPRLSIGERSETEDQNPVIQLRADLVVVPVSITDANGNPVTNLTAEDFLLEEDGRSQQITTLGEPGKTPVELALLFDVSGSVHARFQFEREAAIGFLKEVLKPNDAVSVFSIGLEPEQVQARTTTSQEAAHGLMNLESTKEPTAFFDAVVEAAHAVSLTASPGRRRVLVVISDGEDNHSDRHGLTDALLALQMNDCLFYAMNPSGPTLRLNKISMNGQGVLEALASQTGGMAFAPEQPEDLDTVFHQIATELQAQYLLGYYSTNERVDGQFRRITVRVPDQPSLRIRARRGYYAPKL